MATKIFRTYLQEKGLSTDFESFETSELDSTLSKFYAEARTVNGELYKRSSLFSIRHGLNRHLSVNSQNTRDIIHGVDFRKSQLAFTAATKELKRSGKGGVSHYPPIEKNDLKLMYQYFDLENNVKLQEKVFVDIVLYFGRRGRENLHQLKISDFSARHDAEGHLYIYLDKDELTKNHQENANTAEGRMYAMPDDPLCPVKSFIKYKRHLNPKCDRIFQRPKRNFSSSHYWYDNVPLGHNTIGNLMAAISQKAGLSQRYTNHSLRATLVHTLDSTGLFSGRHIMSVTGHRAESSLKTYTGQTEPEIKRKMSESISKTLRSETSVLEKENSTTTSTSYFEASELKLEPIPASNSLSDIDNVLADLLNDPDDFDSILSSADFDYGLQNVGGPCITETNALSNLSNNSVSKTGQTTVTEHVEMSRTSFQSIASGFPVLNLHNSSNITINYNINLK
ncbi:uncharacterized protein LOC134261458 [Saccostrea cucullata]|uniref:uncharacterized protein LOC134261458 n=1 Tax=Saccostrea cuccullata TaxID=36930 RepID=UPI002ED156D6